ncbi:adenine phosphoribosyltransferase [Pedobacter heparinus]|uniref:Adenine phosphoribosyltransferase n=1 Tax=Pedobacter heparinus (strain ATCC 13125 / DSM 2366 / CIP 104194 / JCM 7457 / NBRC 12017 / NCIMB 9290 / NRRL B-14731 / HIM 762-3) TaxID=485917 RepID=C6Y265_PEDHD|nr:adenine phosphoribosyltransferase [Pedobacter heparinus]ACU03058.1 adenine phosphoribosyltransferase [Pedobacter heparinus DSM 2366]
MIETKIKSTVRDVIDFPKPGIVFKDITPILKDPALCINITRELAEQLKGIEIDVVAGIESRGFLFGPALAQLLNVPFVPIRKVGKLPYKTVQQSYDLEYGKATIEVHEDALLKGQKVLIHDDLLATGGTVVAASKLIMQLGAEVTGYSFIIALDFLKGRLRLEPYTKQIFSLASY